jgi:hypothetical protein
MLRPGVDLVVAGYCMYGSSTQLVVAFGEDAANISAPAVEPVATPVGPESRFEIFVSDGSYFSVSVENPTFQSVVDAFKAEGERAGLTLASMTYQLVTSFPTVEGGDEEARCFVHDGNFTQILQTAAKTERGTYKMIARAQTASAIMAGTQNKRGMVHQFTLGARVDPNDPNVDPATNPEKFILTIRSLRMPAKPKAVYSVNQGYYRKWPEPTQRFVDWALDEGYSARYVGSMVSDVNRTLLYGGIFLYPQSRESKEAHGKLRLLYEASPMSFIMECAGGGAITGSGRVLLVNPVGIHQKCPIYIGSLRDIAEVAKRFQQFNIVYEQPRRN